MSRGTTQRIHRPNALDLAFFAIDDARRRIGLSGADRGGISNLRRMP